MDDAIAEIRRDLEAREPIFHRPEFGTTRADFDRMMTADFCEVGASGARYSREFILNVLEKRHREPVTEDLQPTAFECRRLSEGTYLLTYDLQQPERLTRRSTIWQRVDGEWKVAFHQGTIVQP
jgi:hypothetical protein